MLIKTHKNQQGEIILAVCDKEILGKLFSEGDKQLDVSEDFYNGDDVDEDEAGDLMRNAHIVNIVGDKAIRLAIKEELIDSENIKKIAGIPYAQVNLDL